MRVTIIQSRDNYYFKFDMWQHFVCTSAYCVKGPNLVVSLGLDWPQHGKLSCFHCTALKTTPDIKNSINKQMILRDIIIYETQVNLYFNITCLSHICTPLRPSRKMQQLAEGWILHRCRRVKANSFQSPGWISNPPDSRGCMLHLRKSKEFIKYTTIKYTTLILVNVKKREQMWELPVTASFGHVLGKTLRSCSGTRIPSMLPNIEDRPRQKSIIKKRMAHNGETGILVIASVNTMKAKPVPSTP